MNQASTNEQPRGADLAVAALETAGVRLCFGNPGTSEMAFVSALDRCGSLRAVLCLDEGVTTAAADGYARMTGMPAATLLHLGPGLANGSTNLHNARRARSPLVNIIGDHATTHVACDAPLQSDIEALAGWSSGWVRRVPSVAAIPADVSAAVAAARQPPGQVASLILPGDFSWSAAPSPAEAEAEAAESVTNTAPDEAALARAAALLRRHGQRAALHLGGSALHEAGLREAGRIAAATGARLIHDTFTARVDRGAGRVPVQRIPYFAEEATAFLADLACLVSVGTRPPVSFFAYPGRPSEMAPPDAVFEVLTTPAQDGPTALALLADVLGAPAEPALLARRDVAAGVEHEFDHFAIGRILARHLPEHAIIADDGVTAGFGSFQAFASTAPHTHLFLTGGAIGIGLPLAVGAALGAPGHRVVSLNGDGSAMYNLQALWTQAREQLPIVNIVFANRAYRILDIEAERIGARMPLGPRARSLIDLTAPALDWVSIAAGMGVAGSRARDAASFEAQLVDALAQPAPTLIEAVIP